MTSKRASRSKRKTTGHHALGGLCRILTIRGTRRVLCWDENGRIKSNKRKDGDK